MLLRVEGKQNSLFPEGPVIKCSDIPSDSKIEKTAEKLVAGCRCPQYERQSKPASYPTETTP